MQKFRLHFFIDMLKFNFEKTKEKNMQNYSVDINKLDKLSVFQLREVGAKVGVKNPTTLRTEELRKAIIDVVTGKVQPYKKAKSGRPHKSVIPDEDWEKIVGVEENFDLFCINDNLPLYSYYGSVNKRMEEQVLTGYTIEMYGEFLCTIGNADEVKLDKCAKITPDTQFYGLLHVGDKITYNVKIADTDKLPIVTKILTINDCEPMSYLSKFAEENSKCFDKTIDFTLPQLKFINDNFPIKQGQRILIAGEKDSGQTYLANSIAKDLSSEYKVVYFAISKKPEERIELPNVEYFFTTFDIKPIDVVFNYEIAISRAKNLCNTGNQTILVIDDLADLIKNFSSTLKQKKLCLDNSSEEVIQRIKTLFAAGKNTEHGSLTIFACMSEDDTQVSAYLDEATKYCNCNIYLSKTDYLDNKQVFYDKEKTQVESIKRRNIV